MTKAGEIASAESGVRAEDESTGGTVTLDWCEKKAESGSSGMLAGDDSLEVESSELVKYAMGTVDEPITSSPSVEGEFVKEESVKSAIGTADEPVERELTTSGR